MICPNCGNKIKDDNLYCEKCGTEFQIVPDFDVEVDGEIDKTMRNLRKSRHDDDFDDIEFDTDPNLLSSILNGHAGNKIVYILMGIVLILVIAIIAVQGRKIAKQNTLEYQLQKISEYAADKNYSEAITYLEKAHKMTGDTKYLFTIADYYYTMGRENDALYTLADIIGNPESSKKDVEDAYRKTITLYEKSANYTKLNELIKDCTIDSLKQEYSAFLVSEPVFSAKEGEYEEEILLKLSSDTVDGVIHYTLDGTVPDENSEVFSTPIFLENGNYTVNAVCYNAYGVASPVVTQKYLINIAFEFKPIILTEPGDYSTATQIIADIPATERYYYTTDGSDPTQKSSRYNGPIQMPYGKTTFKFVSFAMDGTQSTVLEVEYNLHMDGLQPEDCHNALRQRLVDRLIIDDTAGFKEGLEGYYTYKFNTVYEVGNRGNFYFYVEYLNSLDGTSSKKTGTIYAVKVSNPEEIYKVTGNATVGFNLNDF